MTIKSVKISGVHGVECELDFPTGKEKLNGESKLGKTTALNCIMACVSGFYPGYGTSLPDGKVELTTSDSTIVMNGKKIAGAMPLKEGADESLIRYIVPGNFFKLTKGTPEQRLLISKVLGIDSAVIEEANDKIKEIKSQQKEFDAKKDQISDDCIRLEESLESKVKKPEEVERVPDNSAEIINAYNTKNNEIVAANNQVIGRNNLANEDYQATVRNAEATNGSDIARLKREISSGELELNNIHTKATQADGLKDYVCTACNQTVKVEDPEVVKGKLRQQYAVLNKEIETKRTQLTNLEVARDQEIQRVQASSPAPEATQPTLDMNISIEDKAAYLGMTYTKGNIEEYSVYLDVLKEYNDEQARIKTVEAEIELKDQQLKDLNNNTLDKDLKKWEKVKTEFNKMVETKVKETGLDIRLFKTLKNGNIKDTFELYDKEGNSYGATSTGNELFMEVLIAKLFVDYLGLDFILFDKWESVGPNLRKEVLAQVGDLQVIATEVSKEKKITVKKLS